MTRSEFFSRLNAAMGGFPATEVNRANEYYNEYWDDAAEAGKSEEEISSSLDPPEDIARRFRSEFAFERAESDPNPKNVGKLILIVFIAVFAAPIALPVALGAFFSLFGIAIAMFSIAVAFACAVLTLLVVGVALVAASIPAFAGIPLVGLWMLGGGLLLTGLGMSMGVGCIAMIRGLFRLCGRVFRYVHSRVSMPAQKRLNQA